MLRNDKSFFFPSFNLILSNSFLQSNFFFPFLQRSFWVDNVLKPQEILRIVCQALPEALMLLIILLVRLSLSRISCGQTDFVLGEDLSNETSYVLETIRCFLSESSFCTTSFLLIMQYENLLLLFVSLPFDFIYLSCIPSKGLRVLLLVSSGSNGSSCGNNVENDTTCSRFVSMLVTYWQKRKERHAINSHNNSALCDDYMVIVMCYLECFALDSDIYRD